MWSRLHSSFVFIVDIFKSYQQHWGLTSHASITFRKNVFYPDLKVVSVLEIFEFPNFTMLHFMTSSSASQVNTVRQWKMASLCNTGVFQKSILGNVSLSSVSECFKRRCKVAVNAASMSLVSIKLFICFSHILHSFWMIGA